MNERNIAEIIGDICELREEVERYILNTPHYIFYWITNREIKDYIEAFPEDFEDNISLKVDNVSGGSATVTITFDHDHPYEVESIQRFCFLPSFREFTEEHYAEFNGSITELKLKEMQTKLDHYKKRVSELEEEIAQLNPNQI